MLSYIIKSGLCLIVFYLFYIIVLSNVKMLKFNRFYLLFTLILSLILPVLTIPIGFYTPLNVAFNDTNFQNEFYQFNTISLQKEEQYDYTWIYYSLYFSISAILLLRFVINLLRLRRTKSKNPFIKFKGCKLVLTNDSLVPYSFFSTIYVNSDKYKNRHIPKEIILHEMAHISQWHSLDIILIEFLRIILWFNPVLIFYKKSILLNHEYLADDAVILKKSNLHSYQELIINLLFKNKNIYLASSFNYSFTKKRLIMMTKNNSFRKAVFRKIAVIPLIMFVGMLIVNAQTIKHGTSSNLPPPPYEQNMWWTSIVSKHKIIPEPFKMWCSMNLFETGDKYSFGDDKVTLENAFILVKATDEFYRIIKAKYVIHDIKNKFINAREGTIETYKNSSSAIEPVNSESFKESIFELIHDNMISPPPPPPPPKK